jgi:hypothetical protein
MTMGDIVNRALVAYVKTLESTLELREKTIEVLGALLAEKIAPADCPPLVVDRFHDKYNFAEAWIEHAESLAEMKEALSNDET